MKKFKLIAASLLASSMLFAGCEKTHTHVDENGDFICDKCSEALQGIKTIAFDGESVMVEAEETINLAEKLIIEAVNGASSDVVYSSSNERVATVDESGVVTAHDFGSAVITATSVFDSSKKATFEVDVPFEKGFADQNYKFVGSFPIEEVKEYTGSTEEEIFIPNEKFCELGLWYNKFPGSRDEVSSFTIIFNIGSLTERDSEYGNEMISDLESFEKYYPFLDVETEEVSYMSHDSKHILSWEGVYNEEYTNMYLTFTYTLVSENFYNAERTTDTDWSIENKEAFELIFGDVIPFSPLGVNYFVGASQDEYTGEVTAVIYDLSCDHGIIEDYISALVAAGYKYSKSEGAYFKEVSGEMSIFVQAMFTTFGNTIVVYNSNTVYTEFPQAIVDNFVSNIIGSSNLAIGFNLSSEEIAEYRVYIENDDWDYFPYADSSCEVRGLYATYEEFIALKEAYEAAGFELTYSEDHSDGEHIYAVTLLKGALEVSISCEPQLEINWDSFEFIYYWDYSTICLNVHHSEFFESDGVHFYSKSVSMRTDDYPTKLAVSVTGIDGAKITYSTSNKNVAYVDEDGYLVPVGAGVALITVSAGGTSDSLVANISWGYSDEFVDFSEIPAGAIEEYPTSVYTNKLNISFEQGEGAVAPVYDEESSTFKFVEGNIVTFTGKDGRCINEIDFIDSFDYGEEDHGTLVPSTGSVNGMNFYASNLTTKSIEFVVSEGSIIVTGFYAEFDDTKVHTARMSLQEMVEYTVNNYLEMGYTITTCEPIYGEGYEDEAWTLIITDDFMYTYGDYGDDALEYEMWDLAYYVPEEFTDGVFSEMYMGTHYMYEVEGCMADVSVDGIELDIMIYVDPEGSGNTIIRIDFWNWN